MEVGPPEAGMTRPWWTRHHVGTQEQVRTAVLERVGWWAWSCCVGVASAAMALNGWIRFDRLGGSGRRAVCVVTGPGSEVLPADCWLSTGGLGVGSWAPAWGDLGWWTLLVVGVAVALGALVAGSGARRQALVVRVVAVWVAGGLAASVAFELQVADAAPAESVWMLRAAGWGPLAFAAGILFGLWAHSPWRTLSDVGLRAKRRERAARRARRGAVAATVRSELARTGGVARRGGRIPPLPEIGRPLAPVRLSWPLGPDRLVVGGVTDRVDG